MIGVFWGDCCFLSFFFFNLYQRVLNLELWFSVIEFNFNEEICCIYLPCSVSGSSSPQSQCFIDEPYVILKSLTWETIPFLLWQDLFHWNQHNLALSGNKFQWFVSKIPEWMELIGIQAALLNWYSLCLRPTTLSCPNAWTRVLQESPPSKGKRFIFSQSAI